MRWLTRIRLGKGDAARLRIQDAYTWHQRLWDAFPDRDAERRKFLFRVDDMRAAFRVFLLSPEEPVPPSWGRWETKQVAEGFLKYDRYAFELRANPTMRRSKDHRRLGIYGEDRLRDWMLRKGETNGFRVEEGALTVDGPMDQTFVRDRRRGKHVSVDFRGLLDVADRERFRCAFEKGIGSAKAFGFGLLMLRPVGR